MSFFHWQNLNDKPGGGQGPGWRHGRCWWHFGDGRDSIGLEWLIPSKRCGIGVEVGAGDSDRGWHFNLCIPPLFSLYLNLDFKLPAPKDKEVEYQGRKFWLYQCRTCDFYIADWTIRLTPWGRWGEWRRDDPWWVRGVSLDLKDLFLGKTRFSQETLKQGVPFNINLAEGIYSGKADLVRRTWKRPRWRTLTRLTWDTTLESGHSIPFPGKGENSWDCGMDGLCGWSAESRNGEDIERLIAEGVKSVLESRRRYGGSVSWQPEREGANLR